MKNVHLILFNWRRQYEKTQEKLRQFKEQIPEVKVTVINSDDEHNEDGWINLGESAYFNALMLKAVDVFDGDILLHVQADASCDDWRKLVDDALMYHKKYNWGVYAPNVNYTWYDSSRADISTVEFPEDKNLKMVGTPDCIIWFIDNDIINLYKDSKIDMTPYHIGWGWDLIFSALSYNVKRPVMRDYNITVKHPPESNYNKDQGEREMADLFKNLPAQLQETVYYIKGPRNHLTKYFQ